MKKIVLFILVCSLTIPLVEAQKNKKKNKLKELLGVKVDTKKDKFEGTTTYIMRGNTVKIKGQVGSSIAKGVLGILGGSAKISIMTTRLQLENHITKTGKSELAVILKVSIKDDAQFRPMTGESLIFLVDDERIGLSTEGKYNAEHDFQSNSKVFARYSITKEQLEQIINAEKVEFRLIQQGLLEGASKTRDKSESGTNMEGEFSKKNFKAWKDFYKNYVITTP